MGVSCGGHWGGGAFVMCVLVQGDDIVEIELITELQRVAW